MHASVVAGVLVRHRAHQAKLVRQPGEPGHELAYLDARHVRGNRPERAAHLLGGVWLQVQAVDMTGAAILNDENTRFARRPPRPRAVPGRAGPEQVRQSQPQEADAAHLEELPAAEQAVRTSGRFVDVEHGITGG